MNLEIQRYLVVSMEHVTEEDMEKLKEPKRISAHQFPYGTYVNIPSDSSDFDLITALAEEGYSDTMILLMQLAKIEGCQFLKIDEEGPVLEGYDTYEW